MKLFRMSHEERYGGKFAWSNCYGPLPQMPYLEEIGEDFRTARCSFWESNRYAPGLTVDKGGSVWGNCISVSLGFPHECYSGEIVRDLQASGIDIWRSTEMPIAEIFSKRLQTKKPPQYYVLEAERGIDASFAESGFQIGPDGKPDMRARNPAKKGPLTLALASWNEKDLFSLRSGATMNLHCTEKVKHLAEARGWTNVKFTEVPVV